MPWSNEKKAQVEEAVGSLAYTSSDESDFSEDENGQRKLSRYLVKRLPWERTSLTKVKRELDEAYSRNLDSRKIQLVTRRRHPMPSTRRRPTEPLEWAVRTEIPAPAPSTQSPSSTCSGTPIHPLPAVIPPTSTRPPSLGTPPTRTSPPSSSRPTTGSPLTRPSASSVASCPTRTKTPSPSTSSALLPATVTPCSGTIPSRSGTSSLLPDCSSTPKTSKPKKPLKSKKDNACRRSASPAY